MVLFIIKLPGPLLLISGLMLSRWIMSGLADRIAKGGVNLFSLSLIHRPKKAKLNRIKRRVSCNDDTKGTKRRRLTRHRQPELKCWAAAAEAQKDGREKIIKMKKPKRYFIQQRNSLDTVKKPKKSFHIHLLQSKWKAEAFFFGLRAFRTNMFTGLIDGWTQAWTSLTLIRLVEFWLPTFLLLPAIFVTFSAGLTTAHSYRYSSLQY